MRPVFANRRESAATGIAVTMENVMSYLYSGLPPITLSVDDAERLLHLADVARARFPSAAALLNRELERADVVSASQMLPGVVAMGSDVDFRDDLTCEVRRVTLVYPHEADVTMGKISVLTPIGAALIGLSVRQSIEWETNLGDRRSLTVLRVSPRVADRDGRALAKPENP
jgi:regulator of nucleoside diphosphate kinase